MHSAFLCVLCGLIRSSWFLLARIAWVALLLACFAPPLLKFPSTPFCFTIAFPYITMSTMLKLIANEFPVTGTFIKSEPLGTGHINDTLLVTFVENNSNHQYVFQRINNSVFKEPLKVMQNIILVTQHLQKKHDIENSTVVARTRMRFLQSKNGHYWCIDQEGKYWRVYHYIDRTYTLDMVQTEANAYIAGAAFAKFQKELADLGGEKLHETIPDFHNTPKRYHDFENAVDTDRYKRARSCKTEIDFAQTRSAVASAFAELIKAGSVPVRIVHNDAKLNNVLIDETTHKGLCIIDLDTVMPGTILHDFGDLVRSSTSLSKEDEQDLSKVFVRLSLFTALAQGYISEARDFLQKTEYENLVTAGKVIVFELGIRFLTDYLNGDTYFKIKYPEHNLVRCRTQFKLLQSIEMQETQLQKIINSLIMCP